MLDIDWKDIVGNVLLFFLVFGMSATVDMRSMLAQLKNKKAIATGVFLQFVILPLLGFIVVKTLKMNNAVGITLLVLTSSPGGSYSNWCVQIATVSPLTSICAFSFTSLSISGGAPCSMPIWHCPSP